MKVTYDPEVDVLRILLNDTPIEESDEDKPGVILDYDKDGNIVGLGKDRCNGEHHGQSLYLPLVCLRGRCNHEDCQHDGDAAPACRRTGMT